MTDPIGYSGQWESLRKTILSLRFCWKESANNRSVLVDCDDTLICESHIYTMCIITEWRASQLSTLMKHTSTALMPKQSGGVTTVDRDCWHQAHTSGEQDFIKAALLIFKSQQKSCDCHDDMTIRTSKNRSKKSSYQIIRLIASLL